MYTKEVEIPETKEIVGTGWLPPLPDLRDYTEEQPNIAEMAKKLGVSTKENLKALPPKVDLRPWCSPIENQGSLGSCTAHAGIGIVEYFERRAFGKHIDGSRLFVYKTTRNLMGTTGDTGAWLRNTMGALVLCLAFLALAVSIRPSVVQAESSYSFELFWGTQFNIPTPLTIKQEGEETIKIDGARYESDAWTWFNSPYYAWRIGLWEKDKAWELELVHQKIILKNKPEDVQHFEISHGYNLITINRAWRLSEYYDLILHIGAGIVLTHPETTVRHKEKEDHGSFPEGFYISGPTAQIAIGKRFYLWKGLVGVLEAKFTGSYATHVPIANGYAEVPNAALHGLFGMRYEF